MKLRFLALAFCLLLPCTAFADFQYQQKTQITGGAAVNVMKVAGTFSKQAREANKPIINTVSVKGNRMAHINPADTEIIDLDRETVTRINHNDKTFTVMTFKEMKEYMEKQMAEAKKHASEQPKQSAEKSDTDVKWDVKVRNTGANKQVAGLETSESILTMTAQATNRKTGEKGNMAMTNDMWMASEIPGYGEVRDFYKRYAQKMGVMYSDAFTGQHMNLIEAGQVEGVFKMADEMSKLKGVPILQVMRMGSTADGTPLPAASEAPLPATSTPSAGEMAGDAANSAAQQSAESAMSKKMGAMSGALGGMMGGFGRKKKQEQQQQQQQTEAAQTAPAAAVLMESTTELTNFSRAPIGEAVFQVPAGYRQVDWRQQEKNR